MNNPLFAPCSYRLRSSALASGLIVAAALSACGKTGGDTTAGQKLDAAVAATAQAAAEAKAKAEVSMAKAGDAMKDATQKAEAASSSAGGGMAATADDLLITASVASELAKDADLSALKIDVDTKGGVVTLNGPAPSAVARDRASAVAKRIKGVTSVENKLVVKSS